MTLSRGRSQGREGSRRDGGQEQQGCRGQGLLSWALCSLLPLWVQGASVCLGVNHTKGGFWLGLPWAGEEGPWGVWVTDGNGCGDGGEQPGLTEELELPKSPRDGRWAAAGRGHISSRLLGP